MAKNDTAAAVVQQFRDVLTDLAGKRVKRDDLKSDYEHAQEDYKRVEQAAATAMLDAGMTSVKLDGLGLFNVQSRQFVKVLELKEVMKWAAEAGLLSDVVELEDGRLQIPFEVAQIVDEEGRESMALVNGILRAQPYRKPISDHTRAVLDETEQLPPGVDMTSTTYITWRRK